jgi:predicted phage terminase large subunit-like protein
MMNLSAPNEPDELQFGLADAEQLSLALERSRLRASLYDFLLACWPLVEPTKSFVPNWHINVLCHDLQNVMTGNVDFQRWVINIPPGTLKSILINVVFPAWVWARWPQKRFLTAAYGSHLTVRDNLRVRGIIESPWYQALFPLKLEDDQNTKTRYNNDRGGWRIATSIGGMGTGEHPDIIIIDDPTTAKQAASEAERSAANDWYDHTMSTRGGGRHVYVFLVMQRLHEDDLSGHLIKRGGVHRVCFPMRYEKCTCSRPTLSLPEEERCALHRADPEWAPDPRDPRTEPGELLFPDMFTEEVTKRLELDLGPYDTAGQLQQRPAPEGGGLFKRGWFKFVDALPKNITREARGWDTASTPGGGDYTVGVRIVELPDDTFIVADVQRDQLSPAGVDKLMKAIAETDGKDCAQREEKEGGASGLAVAGARAKLLKGFDYRCVPISGSKITRSKPFRAQVEAGNVSLLRASWNEEYLRELCSFPTAAHDDQVDASSCAFNAVLLEPKKRSVGAIW